jgi:hypothetical protein
VFVPRVLQALVNDSTPAIDRHTFVDDALESDDREQSARNGGGSNGAQDDQTEQATGVAARLSFEEEVSTAGGRDFGGHGGGGGEGVGLAEGGWWHWKCAVVVVAGCSRSRELAVLNTTPLGANRVG